MADEPEVKDDGKEIDKENETPKPEERKMADVDFRTAAKNAGYALVPEADLKNLNDAQEQLKTLRSIFPEEARGKESEWVKNVTSKASQADELSEKYKSFDDIQKENESLKEQNQGLSKAKKMSDMWGHVNNVQRIRNVRVHDRFIDEDKLEKFELDKHDLSKEEGVKKFTESLWKDVLEPAYKEQTQVVEQVGGGSRRAEENGKGGTDDRDDDEKSPSPWGAFGSMG